MNSDSPGTSFSIVVPCYQSGEWLGELVSEINKCMKSFGRNWDIWLIDDASPDNGMTRDTIRDLTEKFEHVHGVVLQFNSGQTAAQICGYVHSKGDYIVNFADDFQNPPSEIPKLINAAMDNPDVDCIFGKQKSKKHSFFRNVGSKMVGSIYRRSKHGPGNVAVTAFSIMNRGLADSIIKHDSRVLTFGPMILQNSSKLLNIDVNHDPRKYGSSGYGLGSLVDRTFDVLVNSGRSPLRFFSVFGLLVSLISFLIGGFFFFQYVLGNVGVSGFTTIVTIVTFLSGLTILMLGILFEYIIRIVTEVSNRPLFHEKEIFR
jgi:glycosyltransferase involved in cell wall biosynthesis